MHILTIHRCSILKLGTKGYTQEECESWAAGLVAERYVAAMKNGETFYIASMGDQAVGFCSYKANRIIGLYVSPEVAQQGVGKMLLIHIEALIAKSGHSIIKLESAYPAIGFYQKNGYEALEYRDQKTRGGLKVKVCAMSKEFPHAR